MKPFDTPKLGDVIKSTIIIKHNENTQLLNDALTKEGMICEEQAIKYTQIEETYPAAIKCLINHAQAWEKAKQREGFTLIVEADFVPVVGFSSLPLPFLPEINTKAMAWLYSVGPVIYHVVRENWAIYGHNSGTVAYVIDKTVARDWLDLFQEDVRENEYAQYRNWEVYMPIKLRREKGVRCYIPYKMYGEHGGKANKEHKISGYKGWHEADSLAGKLHFLPIYANSSLFLYLLHRIRGKLRGLYRFSVGKYFDGWHYGWYKSHEDRFLKLYIAINRLI